MKEYRVYTRKMTEYLTSKNFHFIRTVQDVFHPAFLNWMFEDTPELQQAIQNYLHRTREEE